MLKREISELGLLEAFAAVVAVVMIAAVIGLDDSRDTYVLGAIISIGSVVACEVERVRRKRQRHHKPKTTDAAKTEPESIRYGLREAVLGVVFGAMALATVLVEGRPRVAFVTSR